MTLPRITPQDGATLPASLSVSVELMDDQFMVKAPALSSSTAAGACAVIERPLGNSLHYGSKEVFTVDGTGNNLSYFRWDPKSKTGWDQEMVPVGFPITEVLAFYQEGVTVVVAADPNDGKYRNGSGRIRILQRVDGSSTWEDRTEECVRIGYGYTLNNVGLFRDFQGAYHITAYVSFGGGGRIIEAGVLRGTVTGPVSTDNLSFGANCQAFLVRFDPYEQKFLWLVAGEGGSYLALGQNAYGILALVNAQGLDGVSRPRECRAYVSSTDPGATGPTELLLLTGEGQLQRGQLSAAGNGIGWEAKLQAGPVPQYPPQLKKLRAPVGVTHFDLGRNADGKLQLFLTDNEQRLWILRQTGTGADGSTIFADRYVPLGNPLLAFACPASMLEDAELMGVTAGESPELLHLQQGSEAKAWKETMVHVPDENVAETTLSPFYFSEITVLSAQNTPVPDTDVEVRATHRICVYVDGVSHFIDRKTPLVLKAGHQGSVTLVSRADSLSPAALMVRVPSMDPEGTFQTFTPAANVHYRLSGQDPACPITGDELLKRQLVTEQSTSSGDREQLAELVKQVGHKMMHLDLTKTDTKPVTFQNYEEPLNLAAIQPGKWHLSFSSDGHVVVKPGSPSNGAGGAAESWLSDLWGDAVHFFKHVVDAIEHIAVEVGEAITVAINEVHNFVVKTVEEAGEILHMVFQKIAAVVGKVVHAIEEIIQWIKMAFTNVGPARDALEYLFNAFLDYQGQHVLPKVRSTLDADFDKLIARVNDAFDKAESMFGDQTFGALTASAPSTPVTGPNPLTDDTFRKFHRRNSVRFNYAHTRIAHHLSQQPTAAIGGSVAAIDTTSLTQWVEQVGNGIYHTVEDDIKRLAGRFKEVAENPQNWEKLLLAEVIDLARSVVTLVLKEMKALFDLLLNLAEEAVQALKADLNEEVAFLSWLVKVFSGKDARVTWLDLYCTALAFPVSILYEAVNGQQPFPPPSSLDIPWAGLKTVQAATSRATPTYDQVMAACYSGAYILRAIVQTPIDLARAGEPDNDIPEKLALFAFVPSFVVLYSGFPYHQLEKAFKHESTAADDLTIANWSVSLLNFIAGIAGKAKATSMEAKVTVSSLLGGVRLVLGIVTAVVDDERNGRKVAELCIKPIPAIGRPLILVKDSPVALIPAALDVLGYVTVACLHIASGKAAK